MTNSANSRSDIRARVMPYRLPYIPSVIQRVRPWAMGGIRVETFSPLLSDIFAVTVTFSVAYWMVGKYLITTPNLGLEFQNLLTLLPLLLIVAASMGGYKSLHYRRAEREIELGLKAVTLSFLLLYAFDFIFFKTLMFSRYFSALWYGQLLVAVPLFRFLVRGVFHWLWSRGRMQQRALAIGSPQLLRKIQDALAIQRFEGCQVIGYLAAQDAQPNSRVVEEWPQLGELNKLEEVVKGTRVELLIVAMEEYSPQAHEEYVDILHRANELGLPVKIYSEIFNFSSQRCELDEFSGLFVLPPVEASLTFIMQRVVKKVIDVGIGLVGSLLTLLLFPLVALLIVLDDPGPIFYRQEFLGARKKRHHYWKFRSMKVSAQEILESNPTLRAKFEEKFKLEEDPRITRVGRFLRKYSLDELPEFFSVLFGTLSFVGPRTISEKEAARYCRQLEKLLSFKPGLTGFWQVMGRQTTTYEERVQMDMFYIDRWSIWLDLHIIAKTFWKVVTTEGAH